MTAQRVHEKELQNVLALDANARTSYFIRRVADWEHVWVLDDDGWATAADDDGRVAIPMWSAEAFADACRRGAWSAYRPLCVPLDDVVDDVLLHLDHQGVRVAVFPTPAGKGPIVEPLQLLTWLEEELRQYV